MTRPGGIDGKETGPDDPHRAAASGAGSVAARTARARASGDRARAFVIFGLALAAGSFLRLWRLGGPSLWTDELATWWAASAPSAREVVSRCYECLATPPLSFLVDRALVAGAGASEWSLRLPSALAGIATIAVVFAAGRRIFSLEAAALASAVLAVHPQHLWISADARPYALAALAAACSVWAFSESVRSGRPAALAAWVLSTAALLFTHFLFAPLLLAQVALYAALRARRASGERSSSRPAPVPARTGLAPGRFAAGLGAVLLLGLPLLPQILSVARRSSILVWQVRVDFPPGLDTSFLTYALTTAVLVWLVYEVLSRPDDPAGAAAPPGAAAAVALDEPSGPLDGDVKAAAASRAWLRPIPGGERQDVLLLVVSYLLPVLLLGASLLTPMRSLAQPRYTTAYLPACALLLGWMLSRPARASGRWVLAGTFLVLVAAVDVAPSLATGRPLNVNTLSEDWRGAARYLRAQYTTGDAALVRSGLVESDGLFDGTFPGSCRPYLASPLTGFYWRDGPPLEAIVLPARFASPPYPASYDAEIRPRIVDRDRVWVVMISPPDPRSYFLAVVSYVRGATGRAFAPTQQQSFGHVTVTLLTAPP